MNARNILTFLLVIHSLPLTLLGQSREIIEKTKSASAMVVSKGAQGESSGSAFCIHSSGLFVTNEHVVRDAGELFLILDTTSEKESRMPAKVVRVDKDNDLAVLQANPPKSREFVALELGESDSLYETQRIVAFGYPLGNLLSMNEGSAPAISISVGRISSLRKKEGSLRAIQLDAELNHGNSGGPVINEEGQVIGVVVAGILNSGIRFGISVNLVREFLEKPILSVQIPKELSLDDGRKPRKVSVHFSMLNGKKDQPLTLEVEGKVEGFDETFPIRLGEVNAGHYEGEVILIPNTVNPTLEAEVTTAAGKTSVITIEDFEIENASVKRLSEVARIRKASEKSVIYAANGKTYKDEEPAYGMRNVQVGAIETEVDLARFKEIKVTYVNIPKIHFHIELSSDGQSLAKEERTLTITGGGAILDGGSEEGGVNLKPISEAADKEIKLPGIADDFMVAGAGKYWAFWIKSIKSVALLDMESLKIVRYIKIPSDDAIIACGRTKLVAAIPKDKLLMRYDLETGERELVKPYPFSGVLKTCAMGSASHGPLYVVQASGTDALDRGEFLQVEINSFREVPIDWKNQYNNARSPHVSYRDQIHLRVNAAGDHLCFFQSGVSPMGVDSLVRTGKSIVHHDLHDTMGAVYPGNYRKHVFTSGGVVLTANLNKINEGERGSNAAFIPSYEGPYYLGLTSESDRRKEEDAEFTATLHTLGQTSPLLTFQIPQSPPESRIRFLPSFHKQVYFSVPRKFIGMVANSRDSVYVKYFDAFAELDKRSIDYFYIASTAPMTVAKGAVLKYQIDAPSNKDGIKFELTQGPRGMTCSGTGLIQWQVPANFDEDEASVIVSVSNETGEEILHVFNLMVQ